MLARIDILVAEIVGLEMLGWQVLELCRPKPGPLPGLGRGFQRNAS